MKFLRTVLQVGVNEDNRPSIHPRLSLFALHILSINLHLENEKLKDLPLNLLDVSQLTPNTYTSTADDKF